MQLHVRRSTALFLERVWLLIADVHLEQGSLVARDILSRHHLCALNLNVSILNIRGEYLSAAMAVKKILTS